MFNDEIEACSIEILNKIISCYWCYGPPKANLKVLNNYCIYFLSKKNIDGKAVFIV